MIELLNGTRSSVILSSSLDFMTLTYGALPFWNLLIISSGESVWHSAVAFQSPLSSPPGEAQLPAPLHQQWLIRENKHVCT